MSRDVHVTAWLPCRFCLFFVRPLHSMQTDLNGAPHRFQINLSGLIDLLSNHLYPSPDVFIRELLQNAADAIRARANLETDFCGSITLHVDDDMQGMTFIDNGIGLTEAEMHRFLAVIGESSKRGSWAGDPGDYIGQFGIGLLACFLAADEIEVTSRSARDVQAAPCCWRGRPDGTYEVSRTDTVMEPGTRVRLRARAGSEPLFELSAVAEAVRHYGGILPWPLRVVHTGQMQVINSASQAGRFPWDVSMLPIAQRQDFLLDYGRQVLDAPVLDAIPLVSPSGGVNGVAYILERCPPQTAKRRHRVYLKRMLLSDSVENLLPSWAFFVQCVVNCTGLRPTAARNAFYQDERLACTQAELGACLRTYLLDLARQAPDRLDKLIASHHLALKALALEDEEFFRLFAQWLPIETNFGRSTLQSYLSRNERLLCTQSVDEFRQIAQIAAAQDIDIINGGYTYDAELVARYGELFPLTPVRFVRPSDIGHRLQGLSAAQEACYANFMRIAGEVLEPFDCSVRIRQFEPEDLPTLYLANGDAQLSRQISVSEEVADDLWRDMLARIKPQATSELCFNFSHVLVRRLLEHPDVSLIRRVVQILYVQALLMGHYPLGRRELALMSDGLSGMLEWSLMGNGGIATWH